MNIRKASKLEVGSIRGVYLSAFSADECELVAKLACDLLLEEKRLAVLSLVAEVESVIIGHVAFSPVGFEKDSNLLGYILAPLAVNKEHQNCSVGTNLVEHGLRILSEEGVSMFFVYGDPDYYKRFGFEREIAKKFVPPYKLQYPLGWHVLMSKPDLVDLPFGKISCVEPLCDSTLW